MMTTQNAIELKEEIERLKKELDDLAQKRKQYSNEVQQLRTQLGTLSTSLAAAERVTLRAERKRTYTESMPASSSSTQPICHYVLRKVEDQRGSFLLSHIDSCADNFGQLVERSNILVDKTNFIAKVWENRHDARKLLFALPSGVGKTMLITMLNSFFNREYANENLFSKYQFKNDARFAIMNNRKLVRRMHKYPVLFVNMDIVMPSAKGIEYQLSAIIANLYEKHKDALINSCTNAQKKKLEKFSKIANNEDSNNFGEVYWQQALQFLIDRLNANSKEGNTIVLVDNYDSAITNFSEVASEMSNTEELKIIMRLVTGFMECLIKADNIEFAMLMGNYKLALGRSALKIFSMERDMDCEAEGDLSQFFGFTEDEMNELCISYKVSDEIRTGAKEYFNGISFASIRLFNTRSAINMLNSVNVPGFEPLRVYVQKAPSFVQFESFFQRKEFVDVILQLIGGKYPVPRDFVNYNAQSLSKLLSHAGRPLPGSPCDPNVINYFLWFLNISGYLVRKGNYLYIPNLEYRHILVDLLTNQWYQPKYNFDIEHINQITKQFELIGQCKHPIDALKSVLAEAAINVNKKQEDNNEVYLQTLVGISCLRLRYGIRCRLDKLMDCGGLYNYKRPDVALLLASHVAFVVELKWDNTKTHPMKQIGENKYFSESFLQFEQKLKYIVAIGISITSCYLTAANNQQNAVEVLIESREKAENRDIKEFLQAFEDELEERYSNNS